MINRTRTMAVLLVLLVLGVVAVVLESRRPNQTERALWFPSLTEEIAGLSFIDIRQDNAVVRLERGARGWIVAGRDQYPADIKRIIDLMASLEQAEKIARKTAKPENHARLGLSNVPGEDGQGTLITLGLEAPASLLVGQTASSAMLRLFARQIVIRCGWSQVASRLQPIPPLGCPRLYST